MEALDQGAIWDHFDNYVILGDSRALGFSEYDFLDHTRVLAGIGETIWAIQNKLPDVAALSPAYIYVCYGVNEVEGQAWSGGEAYAAELEQWIGKLRGAAPGARIIVSSILPVTETAVSRSAALDKLPEYNTALNAFLFHHLSQD